MGNGCSWSLVAMLLMLTACQDAEASALRKDAELTPSSGGCAGVGLCCQGKNNTCRVRRHRDLISDDDDVNDDVNDDDNLLMVAAGRSTCFCDSACVQLTDCCHDYKRTCPRKLARSL